MQPEPAHTEEEYLPLLRRLVLIRGAMTGSGYALARDLVLTAAHVAGGCHDPCDVIPYGHDGAAKGRVVWSDDQLDVALVLVPTEPWKGLAGQTTWGRLNGLGDLFTCQSVGYPWIGREQTGLDRRLEHSHWHVSHITGHDVGRYAMDLINTLPLTREPEEKGKEPPSPWAGGSGSALFAKQGTHLVGVVVTDPPKYETGRIEATRTSALFANPTFVQALKAYAVDVKVHDVFGDVTVSVSARLRERPTAEDVLDLEVVAESWQPQLGPPQFRYTERYRLDALIGVTRMPFTLVVGDVRVPDDRRGPLVSALNAVEAAVSDEVPERSADEGSQKACKPGRRWFELDDAEIDHLREPDAITRRLVAPEDWTRYSGAGMLVGFLMPVVAVEAGLAPQTRQMIWRSIANLRQAIPSAAVVLHVIATTALDAARTAAEVGGSAPLVGSRPATLLIRPGDHMEPAEITGFLTERGVRWAALHEAAAGSGDDPEAFITVLNDSDLSLPDEVDLLRALRSVDPGRHPARLEAHARLRTEPHHWASLAVATECVEDVDLWLTAAEPARSMDPAAVPMVLMDRALTEAMLLELVRRNRPPDKVRPWVEHQVGSAGAVLWSLLTWSGSSWEWDLDAARRVSDRHAPIIAAAFVRCGHSVLDLQPCAAELPFYWAVLIRAPLRTGVAGAIAKLPGHLRAVVEAIAHPSDQELANLIDTLRLQLPHLKLR